MLSTQSGKVSSTKVRTDTTILVRRSRFRAKLGGSFGFSGYTLPIRPNLKIRTDTTILVQRTGYRTKLGCSFGSSRYTLPILPNLVFNISLSREKCPFRGNWLSSNLPRFASAGHMPHTHPLSLVKAPKRLSGDERNFRQIFLKIKPNTKERRLEEEAQRSCYAPPPTNHSVRTPACIRTERISKSESRLRDTAGAISRNLLSA